MRGVNVRSWPEADDPHGYPNFEKTASVYWAGDGNRYMSNQSKNVTEYPIVLHESAFLSEKHNQIGELPPYLPPLLKPVLRVSVFSNSRPHI